MVQLKGGIPRSVCLHMIFLIYNILFPLNTRKTLENLQTSQVETRQAKVIIQTQNFWQLQKYVKKKW